MTKIAFYAPLKAPDHPVPSGDRQMARLIMRALDAGGFEVEVVSGLRAFHVEPQRFRELARAAETERQKLAAQWTAGDRPDLWFTYHPYYKAPDLLGPGLARQFTLPYVTAEASYAGKRDSQGWAEAQSHVRDAVSFAKVNLCFTERDRAGLAQAIPDARLAGLSPFIDTAPYETITPLPASKRLITVAMMRPGDKLASFTMLAGALARLSDMPWHLTVIGDGPARAETMALFQGLPAERVTWRGEIAPEAVPAELAQGGIYVWPGTGEAYGMAYLEAEAAGLPAVAQATAGVPAVVRHDRTGLLTPEGDIAAYASAIRSLLADDARREALGRAARDFVLAERSLSLASMKLGLILRGIAS